MKNKLNMERSSKKFKSPPTCIELLKEFEKKRMLLIGEKLLFSGVGKMDVYNISKPFLIGKKTIIAGRVEAREACADSKIIFFEKKKDGVWTPVYGTPTLPLEDCFVVNIGNKTIIGGVQVFRNPTATDPKNIDYRTVFYYCGCDLSLKKFAVGPDGMKDIRLTPLVNGRIGVFTRPQGENNGNGKIGYVELLRLEDITPKNLLRARIIENQFAHGEWGGVNDPYSFKKWIYVYGHIAYEDEAGAKHYYGMSFTYDPKRHRASPIRIIATRKNFPEGEAKTPNHKDVFFLGGLVRHYKIVTIYGGLSDTGSGLCK